MDENASTRQNSSISYRPTIYVSYERRTPASRDIAQKLAKHLTDTGRFGIFIDVPISKYDEDKYDNVVACIEASDLILIVYDSRYQKNTDCQREANLAAEDLKQFLFVKAEPADFKIEDWFYVLKGGRVDINFNAPELEDPVEAVRAHLFEMLGLNVVRAPSGLEIRKFRTINIQRPFFYFERTTEEEEILKALKDLCNHPEQGTLVIAGDGGVGKTTLVERIMTSKFNRSFFLDNCRIRAAVWLNCFEWQNAKQFGVKQHRQMIRCLLEKINARFGSITSFSRLSEFVNHFKNLNENALFIFDDVFNEEIVQFFRQMFPDVPCCVITRDPVVLTTPLYQKVPLVRQVYRVNELSDEDITEMLQNVFSLDETLTAKQISALAQRCCGLPLIASLLAASLKDKQQDAYHSLMASNVANLPIGGPYGKVIQLFEFSLSQLPEKLRQSFYVFTFFDPGEAVSLFDLAILWDHDVNNRIYTQRLCQLLVDKSLVRKSVQQPTPDEECYFIHQMLHEAAAKHAAEYFKLVEPGSLSKLRLRVITGCLKKGEVGFSTKKLVEAVKQRRLLLLSKIIEKLEAVDLAKLCQQKAPETNGMAFLHYLYTVDWAVNPSAYFGASISYRLIREIIFKLREYKIDYVDLINQDRDPGKRKGKPKNLLHQIYDEKDVWRYTPDRTGLIEMLGQSMQKLHEERKWEESFCLNDAFRKFLDALYAKDSVAAVDAFLNSYDCKALNKNDQGEVMLCAARKGHLEAVVKLSELFPNAARHKNRMGCTAIMFAAANGHAKVVQFLSERYADAVTAKDQSEWTALYHATFSGNLEIMDFLISKSTDVQYEKLLMMAAGNGFFDVVEYLIDRKPEIAAFQDDKTGQTPLMMAARSGHFGIVEYLHLVYPPSVSQVDKHKWTALMYAVSGGHIDTVEFLYHADRTAARLRDKNGLTVLMCAARYGHLDIVGFLFSREPSLLLLKDEDGRTALMHASASGHLAVVNEIHELELSGGRARNAPKLSKMNTFTTTTLSSVSRPGKLLRSEKLLQTIDLS